MAESKQSINGHSIGREPERQTGSLAHKVDGRVSLWTNCDETVDERHESGDIEEVSGITL